MLNEEDHEQFYVAEVDRLLGETQLRSGGDLKRAEHHLCKGLEVVRERKVV